MTVQIPDRLLLIHQSLFIVGVNGSGLFDPYALGLQPQPRITSCWRGYVCEYKVRANKLLLDKLHINLDAEEVTLVNNIVPELDPRALFSHVYHTRDLEIDFTGGLLAAGEFIPELYVHMGFHPAWKYKTVFELIVSHGEVTETRDVSGRMEEVRRQMLKSPMQPGANATKEQIEQWVASTFRLNYYF